MSRRSDSAIVAEIKTLYGRRHEEKLQIQKDMAELNERGWTQPDIAKATGIPQQTVSNWLEAFDEATKLGRRSRLTPESVQAASDVRVAARVLKEAPKEIVERLVDELPRERQHVILGAGGNKWHKARAEFEERERNLTPAEPGSSCRRSRRPRFDWLEKWTVPCQEPERSGLVDGDELPDVPPDLQR